MEDALEIITGGHVTAVKIVLTSVVTALALYQAMLMTVVYGRLRPAWLQPSSAAEAHRAVGDAIVVLVALIGLACLLEYGFEDNVQEGAPGPEQRAGWHATLGSTLIAVLSFKLLVLHRWHHFGRFLPLIGLSLLMLFVMTWLSSAGAFLLTTT